MLLLNLPYMPCHSSALTVSQQKAAENVQNFIGEKEVKKEKKAGRPSNGETVKISLAVPAELHASL